MTVCTFTTQIVLASHPTKREFTYPPIIRRNSINTSIDPFLTATGHGFKQSMQQIGQFTKAHHLPAESRTTPIPPSQLEVSA